MLCSFTPLIASRPSLYTLFPLSPFITPYPHLLPPMVSLTPVGRVIAILTGFGYLTALLLMLIGSAALVDTIYYTGNPLDLQGGRNYGDRHSLSAFQWCDNYSPLSSSRQLYCKDIDMDCRFIFTDPGLREQQFTLQSCSKFNFYRIGIVLGSFFAFIALLLSFFSCYAVSRASS